MTIDEIEWLLEQGERVGFKKATGDPNYLGWLLIGKVRANNRFLELVDEVEAPEKVEEERRRQREPYLVLCIELKRSVHESGGYETERDYRQKDQYWFSSLKDVADQLDEWGYSLEEARSARELDAP